MWQFQQSTGKLSQNGVEAGRVYSGYHEGKNNPQYQDVPDVGPIPQGLWFIGGPPIDTTEHGPYVLHLTPAWSTKTFGRSAFLIHGDSVQHPGEASRGCIIAPRPIRESIWLSGDHQIEVIA
jgi:hypothetical protein